MLINNARTPMGIPTSTKGDRASNRNSEQAFTRRLHLQHGLIKELPRRPRHPSISIGKALVHKTNAPSTVIVQDDTALLTQTCIFHVTHQSLPYIAR